MKSFRVAVATLTTVIAVGSWIGVNGQQPQPSAPLPGAPLGTEGEPIFAAFEGWTPHKDGQNTIVVGYFNRNRTQVIDIPIGPNNRIEPGGPDYGQPTHFEPGRHYGVFGIKVPKDFGTKKLTWTIVANGKTSAVQISLNPPYWFDAFLNPSTGNTPPVIRFAQGGTEFTGPPFGIADTKTASVNQPLELKAWVSDKPATYDPEEGLPDSARTRPRPGGGATPAPGTDAAAAGRGTDTVAAAPNAGAAGATGRGAAAAGGRGGAGGAQQPNFDVSAARGGGPVRGGGGGRGGGGPQPDATLTWKIQRGSAANVKIADGPIRLFNRGDINAVMEATTNVTFSAPGEYVLRAQVNDSTGDGGGGDLCCWTDALVKVNVR